MSFISLTLLHLVIGAREEASQKNIRVKHAKHPPSIQTQLVAVPVLTVGAFRGVNRVELIFGRDKVDRCLHAVVRVVSGSARHKVGRCRGKTVLVEETRDSWGSHAPPVVVFAVKHSCDNRDLGVSCKRFHLRSPRTVCQEGTYYWPNWS